MNLPAFGEAVAKCIIVKFLTNKNVKCAEILKRLRAEFGDQTLSRTQVYDWSTSFKKGWTEVENMQRLHLLLGEFSLFCDRTTNHLGSLLFKAT
jgi:hypothetical protein